MKVSRRAVHQGWKWAFNLQTVQFGAYNISDVFFVSEAANVLQELQVWISVLCKLDLKAQNYKTAAMVMSQTNSVGVELFSPVNTSYCFYRVARFASDNAL